ncbi:hypothetical protein [Altererythrobacter ishigakiensis]|jgi:hypothetical protein|nr:hypothetical protein [Altererythrobacter ishigakiensis]MDX1703639.1 hypothetical protein [Altererythrobacter ishigakiensis]
MSKSIFQDPKKAGLFVGATMVVVMLLVGSEDHEGALVQAAATVESTTSATPSDGEFRPNPSPERPSQQIEQQAEPVTWAEDEDLVDDTSGIDPTPEEFDPSEGDVYYVEDDY